MFEERSDESWFYQRKNPTRIILKSNRLLKAGKELFRIFATKIHDERIKWKILRINGLIL